MVRSGLLMVSALMAAALENESVPTNWHRSLSIDSAHGRELASMGWTQLASIGWTKRGGGQRRPVRKLDICDDSCAGYARNGKCDDGSSIALDPNRDWKMEQRIWCAPGTDCSDCGGWPPPPPAAALNQILQTVPRTSTTTATAKSDPRSRRGVDLLRSLEVDVYAAWTRTQPPFVMVYTDPQRDIDVSRNMRSMRAVEPLYNLYWHRLCAECCAKGGLVLDVGANFGYYSLYAAAMGCRVIAWEPIPAFRAFVLAALQLNNLSHRVEVRPHVVSDTAGTNVSMTVPLRGIWGTASVEGLNVDPSIKSPTYEVLARSERLDDVVSEAACAMKLDVEGYEPRVLGGARRLLSTYPPAAILTEYTPGVMERKRDWAALGSYAESLHAFLEAGYRIWHLVGTGKGEHAALGADWRTLELPALAEVTSDTVAAERLNARNMIADNQHGGFAVPWDLHPSSLHAEFAHNTDLLLTRAHSAVLTRKRVVGVQHDSPFGLGGGHCVHVLRDGTAAEVIGRLCHRQRRNESIARAIAIAEAPRPLRGRDSWHAQVHRESQQWSLDGPMHSAHRRMRRTAVPSQAPRPEASHMVRARRRAALSGRGRRTRTFGRAHGRGRAHSAVAASAK